MKLTWVAVNSSKPYAKINCEDLIKQIMSDHANKYGITELLDKLAAIALEQSRCSADNTHAAAASQLATDLHIVSEAFTETIEASHKAQQLARWI